MTAWLRRYGWLVFFALGALLGWFLSRRRASPIPDIKAELEGIRAERAAEEMLAKRGRTAAIKEVEEKYAREKDQLEFREREEAKRLENDPMALAGFLARAGARRAIR